MEIKKNNNNLKQHVTTQRGKNSWKKRPTKQEVKDAMEFYKACKEEL